MNKYIFTGNGWKTIDDSLKQIIEANEDDVIADELFRVSVAYQSGNVYNLSKDDEKAMSYCQKAAKRGHGVAQLFMAQWLMKYPDDHNDAVMEWLMKAAEQGEPQAMYNLGISYHRGDIEGKVDIERSHHFIRRAAEKLYGAACARMALIYLNGEDGITANKAVAKFWAWEAYINGDKEDGGLFQHLVEKGDVEDGKLNWEKVYGDAAESGERFAYHVMGTAYALDMQDEVKAKEYWSKGSELGCIQSMYNLGVLLEKSGTTDEAIKLYQTSAEQGDAMAQHALASIYYYGNGVDKDVAKAWFWNEKAVNFGYPPARYLLAVMCLQNSMDEILPDKVSRGITYMEQAAQDNYAPAIEYLKRHGMYTSDGAESKGDSTMIDEWAKDPTTMFHSWRKFLDYIWGGCIILVILFAIFQCLSGK